MVHICSLYWADEHLTILCYDPKKLSETKKKMVDLLEQLCIIWVKDMLIYEGDILELIAFMVKLSSLYFTLTYKS